MYDNCLNIPPGSIFKVDLGKFKIYGRILNYGDIAIYKTGLSDIIDPVLIDTAAPGNILLRVILLGDWRSSCLWEIIGNRPLEKQLQHSRYWLLRFTGDYSCTIFDDGHYYSGMPEIARKNLDFALELTLEETIMLVYDHYL
ncbi:hypothetical protein [Taibaiella koreensis]|uniref:hypothetical protein n=1 Tax=Taibaiella koreensis TaxID=1268548 RepID=UPI000E59EF8B|nr:hypothetical protein [Taibaiella koreensis]